MSSRPVLIVHADKQRRSEARALMGDREVFEVDCRAQAIPLLSAGPLGLVLSQVPEFRRLLRDLERHTPATPRAVLCPDDPAAMAQLSTLASEGYDFSTIHEHSLHTLKALIEPRASARVVPASPLLARFVAAGTTFFADVAEVGNDGLGLMLSVGAPVELLAPGLRLEQARTEEGIAMALFFITTYVFTNLGAFLVVHAAAQSSGGHKLEKLAGLSRRSPWLGGALLVFLLSLAGIPFVVGFWAKLFVFLAAWRAGMGVLVAIGVVVAVAGLFYYLSVARSTFMAEGDSKEPVRAGRSLQLAIGVCLVAVVGAGLYPRPLVEEAAKAASAFMQGH